MTPASLNQTEKTGGFFGHGKLAREMLSVSFASWPSEGLSSRKERGSLECRAFLKDRDSGTKQLNAEVGEEISVEMVRKFYVKATEYHRGQTMTEYALILAAVAIVVYLGYTLMGTEIQTLLSQIDGDL